MVVPITTFIDSMPKRKENIRACWVYNLFRTERYKIGTEVITFP